MVSGGLRGLYRWICGGVAPLTCQRKMQEFCESVVANNLSSMITFLQGKLVESLPTQVIVDVNGVGYEVLIPLSSFDKLPRPAAR